MITLLMSVYNGENPVFFRTAMDSVVSQTERVSEFLLIVDGPVDQALDQVIFEYQDRLQLRVIRLPHNVGLAQALNVGLREAGCPWIMRFDSDDICESSRIAEQRKIIEADKLDVFGCCISEFVKDPILTERIREVPVVHEKIVEFSKTRNPFNHMTVCFKKDLALLCGGYPNVPFVEDYALWVRMIARGARCGNSSMILVRARVGAGMVRRRGGLVYLSSQVRLQKLLVDLELKSPVAGVRDAILRSTFALLPVFIRGLLYKFALRKRRASHRAG